MGNLTPKPEPNGTRDALNAASLRLLNRYFSPACADDSCQPLELDVYEDDERVLVLANIPGAQPQDIHIQVEGDQLRIEAEIGTPQLEGLNALRPIAQERRTGTFARAMRLAQQVDTTQIEAAYELGVLTLALPKFRRGQPRQISVAVLDEGDADDVLRL